MFFLCVHCNVGKLQGECHMGEFKQRGNFGKATCGSWQSIFQIAGCRHLNIGTTNLHKSQCCLPAILDHRLGKFRQETRVKIPELGAHVAQARLHGRWRVAFRNDPHLGIGKRAAEGAARNAKTYLPSCWTPALSPQFCRLE